MIWKYDEAVAKDLENSFDSATSGIKVVKVVDSDVVTEILAQVTKDKLTFPIVCLTRDESIPVDDSRLNFTQSVKGVIAGIDLKTNQMYKEQALPISLKYYVTVFTTNVPDMDEMIRELLFKYRNQFFLDIEVPYESKRKIRFGVALSASDGISRRSGIVDRLHEGKLYESVITLECQGCVLLNYKSAHLQTLQIESDIE